MKDKINKINWHINLWIWYGRLSPILFLIGAFALYQILNTNIPIIFFSAWAIFIATGLIWWAWVIKVLLDMVNMFQDIIYYTFKKRKQTINEPDTFNNPNHTRFNYFLK